MKTKFIQKHRIYPNLLCRIQLTKQEGCNRKVWNETLAHIGRLGYELSYNDMAHFLTHTLKVVFPFLYDVSAQSLQQSLKDLNQAFKNHHRKSNPTDKPRFKKKLWRWSVRFPQKVTVDRERGLLYLPRMTDSPIPIILERELPDYTMVTIVKEADERYYAYFIIEKDVRVHEPDVNLNHVGIDLGLKEFAVLSNGNRIKAPKFLRESEEKIKKHQKHLSCKTLGSRRWLKNKKRLSRLHAKVRRQRMDWIHKETTKIANDNDIQAVAVESLKITNMVQNHKLAKSISDASWGLFVNALEYKMTMCGKWIKACPSTYPSTQICSTCGEKTGPKGDLFVRTWTCSHCHETHDRDLNAARNIAKYGEDLYRNHFSAAV